MPWRSASTIGSRVVPTTAAASGAWRLGEVAEARQDMLWPVANPIPDLSPLAWWDFTDASLLFDATSGGASVSAGSSVARAEDISGNGYHITQASASLQPTYTSGLLNGYAGLAFGSSDRLAATASLVTGSTNRTIIAVCSGGTGATSRVLLLGADGGASGDQFAITGEIAVRVAGGSRVFGNSLSASHVVLSVVLDGTDCTGISAWLNAAPMGVSSTANITLNTTSGLTVGENLLGNILELIVWDSALSASDRQSAETYLSGKYGL